MKLIFLLILDKKAFNKHINGIGKFRKGNLCATNFRNALKIL